MTKTHYCKKCETETEFEKEEVATNSKGDSYTGEFCTNCDWEFIDSPDPDALYDSMRDEQMFKEEESKK